MSPNPDIPSFKNPQGHNDDGKPAEAAPEKKEEKKSGAPLFQRPGASKAPATVGGLGSPSTGGATPALKIRGLAGGPKSLLERLKQFQKKDLIFIASGLGVLFMAPLAEHFMMSPTQDQNMKPGFSQPGGAFGEVGMHEPGTGGMAPGGLVGAGSDVITPLNVRDPSALVMAPGSSQVTPPPAATTVAPPPPSSSRDTGGWKDALSAAKSGAEKGSEAAKPGAFRAPGNLAGALRGLSALSGASYGGGPTFNLGTPNASNVPNRGSTGGGLSQVKSAPGYRGVGARSDSSGGNADALRGAAANAGDRFNRPGGAAGNLEAAAKEAIPVGTGTGGGGPSSGGENKGGSGSSSKDNKALGESLAYLKLKMELEKELDLKWSKKKWKEFEFPKMIYEEITKSAISNILGKGIFEPMGRGMASMWASAGGARGAIHCWINEKAEVGSPPDGVFTDNDESTVVLRGRIPYYCKRSDPNNCTPAATQQTFGICKAQGGSPSSGSSNPDDGREMPDRVPSTEQRRREAQAARTGLEQTMNTCRGQYTDGSGTMRPGCVGISKLPGVYDKKEAAVDAGAAADVKLKEAWKLMSEAVAELVKTRAALNGVLPFYGKQGEQNVFFLASKAREALGEVAKMNVTSPVDEALAAQDLEQAKRHFATAQKALEAAKRGLTEAVGDDVAKVRMGVAGPQNAEAADRFEAVRQKLAAAAEQIRLAHQDVLTGGRAVKEGWTIMKEAQGLMVSESDRILVGMAKPLAQKAYISLEVEHNNLIKLGGQGAALGTGAEGGQVIQTRETLDRVVIAARDSVEAAFNKTQAVGRDPFMAAAVKEVKTPPDISGSEPVPTASQILRPYVEEATRHVGPAPADGGQAQANLAALVTKMDDAAGGLPGAKTAIDASQTPTTDAGCTTNAYSCAATKPSGTLPRAADSEPVRNLPPWPDDAQPAAATVTATRPGSR